MKNILYMIDTTGPGGAETLFIELNKNFIQGNKNGLAIIHGSGYVENKLKENALNYTILPGKGSFNIKLLFQIIRIIYKYKIDIIHSHLFGSNMYASIAGILTRTPVVSTFHGLVDINTSDKLLNLKISIVKKGSTIVAVSEKILEHLVKSTTLCHDDILLVPNGIHLKPVKTQDRSEFRKQYNLPESCMIIGCLGNVRPAKDYETAILSIKRLRELNIDVVLLIAGATNHKLYEQFLNLISDLDLSDRIKFIGFVDDPFIFLSNLDIYLMTSTSEGQPISLFQAMASNLPIVGTRCGIEDLLEDGETAWLSPIKSPDAIAENIKMVINSPEESNRRATNAVKCVSKNYDIETMFNKYNDLYTELSKK